jgi:tetratricopeptide (TPR) repeat protein
MIEFYTALEIDPNNSEAYNRRSTARSAIGDYQGAMEDLQQVRMI